MHSFMDFKFNLDRNNVLNVVNTYHKIDDCNTAIKVFDELVYLLEKSIQPIGLYKIEDKPKKYDFESVKSCRKILFCIITLGSAVTDNIEELFKKGKFFEGLLLDAMASALLFDFNSQMYSYIFDWAEKMDLGITCRIAPGDGEIPIEYQHDIVKRIDMAEEYGISIVNGYALNPSKSMTYIHGADENLEKIKRLHSCKCCSNINCCIRDVKERIRKPFRQ